MKIITIVGARPQFIKAAVVSRLFAGENNIQEVIVHTGQHYDINMSDIFFEEMGIPKPHYNLNINELGHGAMTGQMMEKIEEVLIIEKPDWVLVYGDTNSTLAGALAAKKLHLKVAHVEAGLRSYNMYMPEEINRIVTDRISDMLFCPTDKAVENLRSEGYNNFDCRIVQCGDVMLDAALYYADKAQRPGFNIPERFSLCTVHRAENTDDPIRLKSIFEALNAISEQHPILLPLHPRTESKLKATGYDFENSNVRLIPPVGYLEMVWLLKNCEMVMTDSGGLQKEAYFFNKYCITLRDETEWVELVDNGFNLLAGSDREKIENSFKFMHDKEKSGFAMNLYGDGNAGARILKELYKS
jgi:UDP-GlcNAc3NAcA epimerase